MAIGGRVGHHRQLPVGRQGLGQPGGRGAGVEHDRALVGYLGERDLGDALLLVGEDASRAARAGSKPSRSTGIAPP